MPCHSAARSLTLSCCLSAYLFGFPKRDATRTNKRRSFAVNAERARERRFGSARLDSARLGLSLRFVIMLHPPNPTTHALTRALFGVYHN